jgi:hypothetical protein
VRDELEYVVIVGQAASGRRHTEVSALGQHHILSPDTQLEILSKGNSKYGTILQNNVPDPVSSVGIRDVYPGSVFCPSRTSDHGSKNSNKREG